MTPTYNIITNVCLSSIMVHSRQQLEANKLMPSVYHYTGQTDICDDIVRRRHQFLI